eukprot:CAMPEP_0180039122 /NCGR_PEP_ID=MMETSP0984-20121128/32651_1 /TAXON_ID=483367 /ORGANISM="non described non described, Strain CCMP 2436" /LENGTH=40 /DNA_ID= /DNA_START= /DNA_END= /DNA_ORIENTATION=
MAVLVRVKASIAPITRAISRRGLPVSGVAAAAAEGGGGGG